MLAGSLIVPVIWAGEVHGILACGAKRTGELYDPDERVVIAVLAAATGGALDRMDAADARAQAEYWKHEAQRLQAVLDGAQSVRKQGPGAGRTLVMLSIARNLTPCGWRRRRRFASIRMQ